MTKIDDTTVCCCGHVWDEHDEGTCCTVEDCKCIYFEADQDLDVVVIALETGKCAYS